MLKYPNFVYVGEIAWLLLWVGLYGTVEGGGGKAGNPQKDSLLGKWVIRFPFHGISTWLRIFFFFLMILSFFLTISWSVLSHFFFFFLVIRSFTYNNQSLETTQISITSWFDKLLFVFRLNVLCHSVMSDPLWPMSCSPPGSSVHEILQARILEWVAMPSSRESSQPRD